MRSIAVHTCPLWKAADGSRRPGMSEEPDPPQPRLVGWVNVMMLSLGGVEFKLLLTADAA